jgi:hypothetical protein
MSARERRGLTEQAADTAIDQACRMLQVRSPLPTSSRLRMA